MRLLRWCECLGADLAVRQFPLCAVCNSSYRQEDIDTNEGNWSNKCLAFLFLLSFLFSSKEKSSVRNSGSGGRRRARGVELGN